MYSKRCQYHALDRPIIESTYADSRQPRPASLPVFSRDFDMFAAGGFCCFDSVLATLLLVTRGRISEIFSALSSRVPFKIWSCPCFLFSPSSLRTGLYVAV